MDTAPPALPTLTVNRSFMQEFLEAAPPCFGLGLVEEHGRQCGFLALRPDEEIPVDVSGQGFNFGHALYGSRAFEVVHFVFQFYGFKTYNVLINPNNPLVQAVLMTMMKGGDYFLFALNAGGSVTAFRADIEHEALFQLKEHLFRIQHSTTTERQYQKAISSRHPAQLDLPRQLGLLGPDDRSAGVEAGIERTEESAPGASQYPFFIFRLYSE